ncbi:hypothetical protein D3C72_1369930 [compost metagenome]
MPISARSLLMSVRGEWTSKPSTKSRPEEISSMRLMQRSMVLLPEPLGPITTTFWPSRISRSMSQSTWVAP